VIKVGTLKIFFTDKNWNCLKMKEEYKDFIGIYDESVPIDLCNDFVNNYEGAKKNQKNEL